jgi:hypothetical protein
MKVYSMSETTALPFILNLCTRCSWSYSSTPEERTPIPKKQEGWWPQSQSEHSAAVKKLLILPGIEPQFISHPAHSLVIMTMLLHQTLAAIHLICTMLWNRLQTPSKTDIKSNKIK